MSQRFTFEVEVAESIQVDKSTNEAKISHLGVSKKRERAERC